MNRTNAIIYVCTATAFFFFAVPSTTHAQEVPPTFTTTQVQRSYDGCFERSASGTTITVWMKAITCTVTLTNPSTTTETLSINVINLDPDAAEVLDAEGSPVSIERTDTSAIITAPATAGATLSYTIAPWDYDPSTTDFWFVATSDTQSQPSQPEPNPVFVSIMEQMDIILPPFITNSGDVIGGYGDNAEGHQNEYELYDEVFQAFPGSTFMVPGDHDAVQSLDTYFSAFFGPRDYTFVYGNTRFIAMNDTESLATEGTFTTTQLTWLEEQLAAATEEHLIIVQQHPIAQPSWGNGKGFSLTQRLQVANLYTEYGVDLVIAGDTHGYEYSVVDSSDISGMNGSFYQLVTGGAGGKITTYGDDHFYTFVHVSDAGFEITLIDEPDSDLRLTTTGSNDGTTASTRLTIENNGDATIPFARLKALLDTSETIYAEDINGIFYPTIFEHVDGIQRAYTQLTDLVPGAIYTIDVGPKWYMRRGVQNTVSTTGGVTFSALPNSTNIKTSLRVTAAEAQSTINVHTWDTDTNTYEWTERSSAAAATLYRIESVPKDRLYGVWLNNRLVQRVASDSEGVLAFTVQPKASKRELRVQLMDAIQRQDIGVLPAQNGGPNLRIINSEGTVLNSFFAYDKELRQGYDSLWADVDGDRQLELITVPHAGAPSHVRVFEPDGTVLAQTFPFGASWTQGVTITAADVNGDDRDEVIVSPLNGEGVVKVYTVRVLQGKLKQIDRFRVTPVDTTATLSLAAPDMNGDGSHEIVIGAQTDEAHLFIREWSAVQGKTVPWWQRTIRNTTERIALASGDVILDGRDELVVGTVSSATVLSVYRYNGQRDAPQRVMTQRILHAVNTNEEQTLEIRVSDVTASGGDEIVLISQDDRPSVQLWSRVVGNRLQPLGTIYPFPATYTGRISVALLDRTNDWSSELVITQLDEGNSIRVFQWQDTTVVPTTRLTVYDSQYNLGLNLTQTSYEPTQ